MIPLKKIISTSFIIEFLVFCGLAVWFYGIYNYSLEEPTWSFNLLLIIDMLGFTVVGGLLAYCIQIKNAKRSFFLLNVQTIIVALGLIMWGVDVIQKKRVLMRLEHFTGANADLIGKLSVGAGILIIIWSLLKKNIKQPPTAVSKTSMCIDCLSPYLKQTIAGTTCPKCGGVLEDLAGFYERHPDKQDNKGGHL